MKQSLAYAKGVLFGSGFTTFILLILYPMYSLMLGWKWTANSFLIFSSVITISAYLYYHEKNKEKSK